jgi:hypothetical protein
VLSGLMQESAPQRGNTASVPVYLFRAVSGVTLAKRMMWSMSAFGGKAGIENFKCPLLTPTCWGNRHERATTRTFMSRGPRHYTTAGDNFWVNFQP